MNKEHVMRIHWLQHVPFEGLGHIADWAAEKKCPVTRTRLFVDPVFPDPDAFDLLIVMGGPMSVHDVDACPWLTPEMGFIETAMDAGKRILGICLGAQLIARTAGARVYPNRFKEIGWFPVEKTADAPAAAVGRQLADRANVFHWHGETFDIPGSAVHLMRSQGCENQAFALGPDIVGLQYHLETTAASMDALIDNCRHELHPAPFVQTEVEIRSNAEGCAGANREMDRLLDYFFR